MPGCLRCGGSAVIAAPVLQRRGESRAATKTARCGARVPHDDVAEVGLAARAAAPEAGPEIAAVATADPPRSRRRRRACDARRRRRDRATSSRRDERVRLRTSTGDRSTRATGGGDGHDGCETAYHHAPPARHRRSRERPVMLRSRVHAEKTYSGLVTLRQPSNGCYPASNARKLTTEPSHTIAGMSGHRRTASGALPSATK
jgi:hypothetical protein